MNKRQILFGIILVNITVPMYAQVEKADSLLERTIVVENIYNPEIMNANKINTLPTIEEPQQPKRQIEYATESRPTENFKFFPMNNYGETPISKEQKRGYFRIGYGTNNNIDSRLNYRFNWGKKDLMNASLSFNGMDGTIKLPEKINEIDKWDSRAFRTHAMIDWKHKFDMLTLGVKANGENQVFNYLNFEESAGNRHQHNLMGDLSVTLDNYRSKEKINFEIGTGVLYAKQKYAFNYSVSPNPYTELIIRSHAHASGRINNHSTIHIKAQMDNMFITPGKGADKITNTVLQLNPYFTTNREDWNIRIGVHADPIFGDNNNFTIAPDLYSEYILFKGYAIYIKASGGRIMNDFRTTNQFAPYAEFPIYNIENGYSIPEHGYSQLDGQVGFKATIMNEFQLQLYGGYNMLKNQLFSTEQEGFDYRKYNLLMQDDANIYYAGAAIQYSWKDIFFTRAEFEWSQWKSDLLDKYTAIVPELSLRWIAGLHPLPKLNIEVQYHYEQRHKDIANINNLCTSISYDLKPHLKVYINGDNLLNRKFYYDIFHPAQGLNIMIGAALEF